MRFSIFDRVKTGQEIAKDLSKEYKNQDAISAPLAIMKAFSKMIVLEIDIYEKKMLSEMINYCYVKKSVFDYREEIFNYLLFVSFSAYLKYEEMSLTAYINKLPSFAKDSFLSLFDKERR